MVVRVNISSHSCFTDDYWIGIPALVDHSNNDFTIWESGAIVQYIVDRYDKDRKISFAPGSDEYYTQLQWIAFQISGQVRLCK